MATFPDNTIGPSIPPTTALPPPIPMPRPDIATPAPAELITSSIGGGRPRATLAQLMARQRAIAERQAGVTGQAAANIPQGLAQLAWTFVNNLEARQAEREEQSGREALTKAITGIDMAAGPTSEQIAQVMGYDPELGMTLYQQAMAARAAAAKTERYGPVITGPEAQKLGLDPAKSYQLNQSTGQYDQVGGSGVNVSVGGGEKLTEGQSKDLSFYSRGGMANADLDAMENELTSLQGKTLADYGGSIGNFFKTPGYQQAERAAREFLAVVLRKDSGGAITPEELETYGAFYLPIPGDSPAAIADKRRSRATVLRTLGYSVEGTAPDMYKRATDDIEAYRKELADRKAAADPDSVVRKPEELPTLPDGEVDYSKLTSAELAAIKAGTLIPPAPKPQEVTP